MNKNKKEFQQVLFSTMMACVLFSLLFLFVSPSYGILFPFCLIRFQPAHFKSSYKTLYARNVPKKIDSAASFSRILMKVASSPLMDYFPLLLDLQASMS